MTEVVLLPIPITYYCSRDKKGSSGAEATNKRSKYNATCIGGSTMSRWSVPQHFQVKSLASISREKKTRHTAASLI